MQHRKHIWLGALAIGGLSIALLTAAAGCQQGHSPASPVVSPGTLAQEIEQTPSAGRGAAEMWASLCIRCHNSRSPGSLSDAEWDVAMLHMRIQASLTREEYDIILNYLKASN